MTKYFVNYIVDHSCDGFDLARTTRHPLNETRQTRVFATRSVNIHGPGRRGRDWNRTEAKAIAAARDLRVGRAAMLLHEALTANGAGIMAGLISVALLDAHFARRWRWEPPASVIVPVDAAFSVVQRASSLALAGPGRARDLVAALLDHVAIGRLATDVPAATLGATTVERRIDGKVERINRAAVTAGPIELEELELYLVDTVLSPRLGAEPASAIPARAKGGRRLMERAFQANQTQRTAVAGFGRSFAHRQFRIGALKRISHREPPNGSTEMNYPLDCGGRAVFSLWLIASGLRC